MDGRSGRNKQGVDRRSMLPSRRNGGLIVQISHMMGLAWVKALSIISVYQVDINFVGL